MQIVNLFEGAPRNGYYRIVLSKSALEISKYTETQHTNIFDYWSRVAIISAKYLPSILAAIKKEVEG